VFSVTVGDLDNDGGIDIASGSASDEDYEVITWQNDGTPFSGSWTQNDVGASADYVGSVPLGDLDNDGDIDIVSGSCASEDYEIIVWQNIGGSAGYTVTDTAPDSLAGSSSDDDVLKVVVTHNGISGDNHLEINEWDFLLEKKVGETWSGMTTANAQGLFDNLYIDYSADGTWDTGDTEVKNIPSASFSLSSGVQTFTIDDNNADAEIADTSSKTYFLVVDMDPDAETYASTNSITEFRFTFDPDADSLNDDDTEDTSVSVTDSSGTVVPVEIPEFDDYIIPIFGVFVLFVVCKKRKRKE